MKKWFFLSLMLLFTVSAFGEVLESSSVFEGDRRGKFSGDLVAHLTDGSRWKVHPTENEMYSRWDSGDTIHVEVRTDWYWFSRQHKFLLVNETKNERVKVMIVGYPFNPVTVVDVASVFSHNVVYYQQANHSFHTYPVYRMVVKLSNGTSYFMKDKAYGSLGFGDPVYVCERHSQFCHLWCTKYDDLCLISGDQREAKWRYISTH